MNDQTKSKHYLPVAIAWHIKPMPFDCRLPLIEIARRIEAAWHALAPNIRPDTVYIDQTGIGLAIYDYLATESIVPVKQATPRLDGTAALFGFKLQSEITHRPVDLVKSDD